MKYSIISTVPLAVLAAYQANAQVTVYTGVPATPTDSAAAAGQTVDYAGLVSPDAAYKSTHLHTKTLVDMCY